MNKTSNIAITIYFLLSLLLFDKALLRSAIKSLTSSSPTDILIRFPGEFPNAPSTVFLCSMRLSGPPKLVARLK